MGTLIYAKMIIVFPPDLEFSPCSEVIHGSTTFKLTKGDQLSTVQLFNLMFLFFYFLHSNVPDNKCHKQT